MYDFKGYLGICFDLISISAYESSIVSLKINKKIVGLYTCISHEIYTLIIIKINYISYILFEILIFCGKSKRERNYEHFLT